MPRGINENPTNEVNSDGLWIVSRTNGDYDSSFSSPVALFQTEKQAVDYVVAHNEKSREIGENEENSTEWSSYSVDFVSHAPIGEPKVHCVYYTDTTRWTPEEDREVCKVMVVSMDEHKILEDPLLSIAFKNPTRAFYAPVVWDAELQKSLTLETKDSEVFPEMSLYKSSNVEFDDYYEGGEEHFVSMAKGTVVLSPKK